MKKRILLPAVLPALLIVAGCGTDPAETLADARTSFAAQDYDAARIQLTAVLQEDSRNLEALKLLVQTHLRLGDGDAAQGAIDRLKRAGATGAELIRYEAEAALWRGQPRKAIALLGDDATADGWRIRAAALLNDDKPDEALAAFEQGLRAGGDYRLVLDYGRYLLTSGDLAGASAQLARLERERPADLATLMLRGDLAIEQQQPALALEAYRKAEQGYPRRIEPLLGQATALGLQGKTDAAAALADKAAKLRAGDRRAAALQVQFAAEQGKWEKVRDVLQGAEATLPPMSAEGLSYAEALLHLGHAEQARIRFSRALLVAPDNPYARLMLAAAQLETGEAAAALATVRPLSDSAMAGQRELSLAEAAARKAGDLALADAYKARMTAGTLAQTQAQLAQADAAFARGDWAAATAGYRALPGHMDDPQLLKRLALAASRGGNHAAALEMGKRALQLRPDSAEMQHLAGVVRLNAGQELGTARELLERASMAAPGDREYARDYAKAKAVAG